MTDNEPNSGRSETFYPSEENLGRNCSFWGITNLAGCNFPKVELQGRTSCEGTIDDVCLYIKSGREPISLSREQQLEIKTRIPTLGPKWHLPPGEPM